MCPMCPKRTYLPYMAYMLQTSATEMAGRQPGIRMGEHLFRTQRNTMMSCDTDTGMHAETVLLLPVPSHLCISCPAAPMLYAVSEASLYR